MALWFQYIRDVITMIGYLATLGAFLYLFRRDNDKQKQIDSLANLALVTEEQLVLSVMPDLYKNGAQTRPMQNDIVIDLLNRGEQARLIEFNSTSPDIELYSKSLPYVLEKGDERKIFCRGTGKQLADCEYVVEVVFEDKLKNRYRMSITGKGPYVTFDQAELIKNRHAK